MSTTKTIATIFNVAVVSTAAVAFGITALVMFTITHTLGDYAESTEKHRAQILSCSVIKDSSRRSECAIAAALTSPTTESFLDALKVAKTGDYAWATQDKKRLNAYAAQLLAHEEQAMAKASWAYDVLRAVASGSGAEKAAREALDFPAATYIKIDREISEIETR